MTGDQRRALLRWDASDTWQASTAATLAAVAWALFEGSRTIGLWLIPPGALCMWGAVHAVVMVCEGRTGAGVPQDDEPWL